MYKNEVHENIIGEIEAYIKKLTTRKIEFTDKNKADELLARVGIQSSERSRIISLAKNTLSQSEADIKKKDADKITDVSLTMASESPQRSAETSVTDNVTQPDTDVKTKFSRQLLNDTWDDIRDKMYEK